MVVQQDDRDRSSRFVRGIIKLDPITRIKDDVTSWNIRQELLRTFNGFIESL